LDSVVARLEHGNAGDYSPRRTEPDPINQKLEGDAGNSSARLGPWIGFDVFIGTRRPTARLPLVPSCHAATYLVRSFSGLFFSNVSTDSYNHCGRWAHESCSLLSLRN